MSVATVIADISTPKTGISSCMSNYVILSRAKDANQLVIMDGWKVSDVQFNARKLDDLNYIKKWIATNLEAKQTKTVDRYTKMNHRLNLDS